MKDPIATTFLNICRTAGGPRHTKFLPKGVRLALLLAVLFTQSGALPAAPFIVKGTYERTTIVSGKVVEEMTNTFMVSLTSNTYRIETTSMDFGAKATGPNSPLRAAAQGNEKETFTITSGVDAGKDVPPLPSGPDLETLKRYKINELVAVENGGFPSRASREVQALWVVYAAGELFGSNWNHVLTMTNIGVPQKLHRKIVASKTHGALTNSAGGDSFVADAALYCDPVIHFEDGDGTLVAPYNNGYRCLDYKVIQWTNIQGRIFPFASKYRVCQPQDSRPTNGTNGYAHVKDEDDVKPFIEYVFHTTSVEAGPATLGELSAKENVVRVSDWRLLDIKSISYRVTNSQWRSMADLAQDPAMENLMKHKTEIVREELAVAQQKSAATRAAVVPVAAPAARWVIAGFFGMSFAIPLLWFIANRKTKILKQE